MFWRYNLPTLFWLLIILTAYVIPGEELPEEPFISFDKFVHTLIFGILAFQMAVGLRRQFAYRKVRHYATKISLVTGLLYGILLEIIQGAFLPGRFFDIWDIVANFAGIIAGLAVYRLVYNEA